MTATTTRAPSTLRGWHLALGGRAPVLRAASGRLIPEGLEALREMAPPWAIPALDGWIGRVWLPAFRRQLAGDLEPARQLRVGIG